MAQEQSMARWRRHLLVLIAAAAVLAMSAMMIVTLDQRNEELSQQQTQIDELEAELAQAQVVQAEQAQTDILEALGADPQRISEDERVMGVFVETAFTWESGETYAQARRSVMTQFDLDEDGEFLTSFMPPARYNTDSQGQRYYYIDVQGLNSSASAGDVTLDLISVNRDAYRYAVRVPTTITSTTTTDEDGDAVSTTRDVLLLVTVDETGSLSDLTSIATDESTRRSG